MLKTEAGIQMVHVPNKGMGGAVLDLISGQAQVLFASVPALKTQGPDRVRPIAMAEKKRSALLPDLPTMAESGMPGFAVANWSGLLAPAGLDPKIVKKLHDEIVAVLATPEMKEKVKTLGYDLIESTPQEFSEDLDADIKRWGPVAQSAGIVK
jgi:tripartite-type tricarboxylate transporter receptor subunit TctC